MLLLNYCSFNVEISYTYTEYEPVHCKGYKLACVLIKDSDRPAHMRSLIRVFDGRSMNYQESNVSPGCNLRL